MNIPAWQVATWNNVYIAIKDWERALSKLRHLGTTSNSDDESDGLRFGQALWGTGATRNELFGIAWDWREMKTNVVAMSDPMTVLSNIVFLDDKGEPVDEFKRILYLNNAIFVLPWQAQVCASQERFQEALAA